MKKILPILIVAVLGLGGGFFGGMQYQKSKQPAFPKGVGQLTRGNFNFNGRVRTAGGNGVRGEVTAVNGSTVTIKLANGGSQIIVLSSSTTYNKTATASVSDVVVGQTIMAAGTSNSDGSVTATTVDVNPQTVAGFGGAVPIAPGQ